MRKGGSNEVTVIAEMPVLMLTKLLRQLTRLPLLSLVFCFPEGPFQWYAAVSNSAQDKSMLPKLSTPKSYLPEVREKKVKCVSTTTTAHCVFREMRKKGFIIIMLSMCKSQFWKPTLAYFSECLIPACEAFTSVPFRAADDGFTQMQCRIFPLQHNPSWSELQKHSSDQQFFFATICYADS